VLSLAADFATAGVESEWLVSRRLQHTHTLTHSGRILRIHPYIHMLLAKSEVLTERVETKAILVKSRLFQ
jgi:hypothetical protein